ncbi:MAG: HesA/MoeB/ThiF family protein [Mangrovicoccus sp.]
MLLVLALAAVIWGIGWLTKAPIQARFIGLGLLYVAVLGALIILPPEAQLRQVLGGSPQPWLLLGGLVALGAVYTLGLRALRKRVRPENRAAEPPAVPSPNAPFTPAELDRYARHIVLREIGGPGQRRLKQAKVLVIGAGGLGSPVLQYLAASGVGTIGLIDDDLVSNSNLQRQVIHNEDNLDIPKVFSAAKAMKALNPFVATRPYNRRLTEDMAVQLIEDYDLVLDGCDNFETRYMVNRACVAAGVPLISGAITQWEGQLSIYHPASGTPCYQCIFPKAPAAGLAPSCAEAGVIGPLPGVVGAMMATEAIKLITGAGAVAKSEMVIYDGLYGESRKIKLSRRIECPVCGGA